MTKQEKTFIAFMEGVCKTFNCVEAVAPLSEGFKAYCETAEMAKVCTEAYAAGDPSPILSTPKERLERIHNLTDRNWESDHKLTPEKYKKFFDSHNVNSTLNKGYDNQHSVDLGGFGPEERHERRLYNYVHKNADPATDDMIKTQYYDVVDRCNKLIREKLGDLYNYIHSFETPSEGDCYTHYWKYEGPDGRLKLTYALPFCDDNEYIDDEVFSSNPSNYKQAVENYANNLKKPIGTFVLEYNGDRFVWKNTNDITSAGENRRSPLNMLTIYINLLYDKGAREEGNENTKEFWLNRTEEGLYNPEYDNG